MHRTGFSPRRKTPPTTTELIVMHLLMAGAVCLLMITGAS